MPNRSIHKHIMLNLTTLSDSQSELMQGGGRGPRAPRKPYTPKHPGSSGTTTTTNNHIWVGTSQDSFAQAFTLGGKNSLAYNDVTQQMNIEISI